MQVQSELEIAGLTEEYIKSMEDIDKYETLEEEYLEPADYKRMFDDFEFTNRNITLLRELRTNHIDLKFFKSRDENNDSAKLRILLDKGLNPYAYAEFFTDSNSVYAEYEKILALKETGIDREWFKTISDIEKVENLVLCRLDPYDFIQEYENSEEALKKADEIKLIAEAGISYYDFRFKNDSDKLNDIIRANVQPYLLGRYFADEKWVYAEFEKKMAVRNLLEKTGKEKFDLLSDKKRAELMLKNGLNPYDYKEYFADFVELEDELDEIEDKV